MSQENKSNEPATPPRMQPATPPRVQATEALQILAKAASEFRGTLRDHETIQAAVQILDKVVASLPQLAEVPKDGK